MSINIQGKLRIKCATIGGSGGGTPNYTFKTTAEVGGENYIQFIATTTGYFKINSTMYPAYPETEGEVYYTLDDPNGEYTLVSCDGGGNPSGDIVSLDMQNNQITHFNSIGLSGLTGVNLGGNQLTSFNGTGFSSLTDLQLYNNQLTSFNGTGLPSNVIRIDLSFNQLTSFNASPFTSLNELGIYNNPLDSADNDSILAQLDDNGVENGNFQSSGGRTSASDTNYNNLIGKGWGINVNV